MGVYVPRYPPTRCILPPLDRHIMGKQTKKGKGKALDDPPQAPPQPQSGPIQFKLRDGLNKLEEVPEDTEPDDHGESLPV